MKIVSSLVGIGLVLGCTVASAGQLIVTPSASNEKAAKAVVSIDIATDGNVSGFNFFVKTGPISESVVDLSKCVADLPKGFSGHCAVRADGVGVIAYADGKATLQAGVVAVGRLGLPAEFLAKGRSVTIEELTFADVNGDLVSSESVIAE